MTGILSYGAYVPRMRLQRPAVHEANRWFAPGLKSLAKGERAFANWDEDAVTMAVEASRQCLAGLERDDVAAVYLASTSFPFADRQNAGIVKEALNLGDDIATLDVGASQKAGTGALIAAARAAAAGKVLVAASEKPAARPASEAELTNGDAAAAFLFGSGDGIARLVADHSVSADFVDHFRSAGEAFDEGWETRWVRDEGQLELATAAVRGVLAKAGIEPASVTRLVAGIPGRKVVEAVAKAAGITAGAVADPLAAQVGHAGCAQPLVLLARALDTAAPGDTILVLSFGQGADALLFQVTDAIADVTPRDRVGVWLDRSRPESNYLKFLTFAGNLQPELGKRAEFGQRPVLTALYRNRRTVLGLMGGRCRVTGTVQFPRTDISVDEQYRGVDTQDDYPLADRAARILTYTSDNLTFTLDPPAYYGMIEFDGGGRMLAEFTDVDPEAIDVGAGMRMMFRIKGKDRSSGFTSYFWKAVSAFGED